MEKMRRPGAGGGRFAEYLNSQVLILLRRKARKERRVSQQQHSLELEGPNEVIPGDTRNTYYLRKILPRHFNSWTHSTPGQHHS
jgi:hypothetical protein